MNPSPYSTHMPVLEWILKKLDIKRVFEFGMGEFSSELFWNNCKRVISVEMQDIKWYEKMEKKMGEILKSGKGDENHVLYYMGDPLRGVEQLADHYKDERFDLIFVDGSGYSRFAQAQEAFKHTDIVVLHDTESEVYCWERIKMPEYWEAYEYRERNPWTTVLINRENYPDLFVDNTVSFKDFKSKEYLNHHRDKDI